jgi:hypothetical protein
MTANELADELGNILTFLEIEYVDYGDDEILKQASTMLRQQAKEIELLKQHGYSELTEDEIKEVYDQYFDLENFGWLHLQCILEILQKAREK